MPHLDNDEFLTRLEELFAARKDSGSVFLVQKRMTHEPEASTSSAVAPAEAAGDDVDMGEAAADEHREWPWLLRATDGKSNKTSKVKLSTVVLPADTTAFLERYSSLLRTQFASALRPKRKRTDLARARLVRQLTRQAKLRAKKEGKESEPWMDSRETIEAEAQRRVKALEARARAAAAPPAGAGAGAGAGGGSKGKGASAAGAGAAAAAAAGAGPGPGAFRVVLPKVVGPRRGNGVERRRRAEKRRNKVVDKVKRRRDAKLAGSGAP
ncbi:hypothetical protein JCM9279_007230 [Rhodotorula babjevae]